MKTLNLNSGTFSYDKYEVNESEAYKSYRIISPTGKLDGRRIAIEDSGHLQFIDGYWWITF